MKTELVILLLIGCRTMFADNDPIGPPANQVPFANNNASGMIFEMLINMP
jgi:hypothetical protein